MDLLIQVEIFLGFPLEFQSSAYNFSYSAKTTELVDLCEIWKTCSYHGTKGIKTLVHNLIMSAFTTNLYLPHGTKRKQNCSS